MSHGDSIKTRRMLAGTSDHYREQLLGLAVFDAIARHAARAIRHEAARAELVQQRLRHHAARGVAGAEKQHLQYAIAHLRSNSISRRALWPAAG